MLTLSKNYPILVDDEAKSQTLKFWSSDSKESYSKNFKSGWEYENSEDLVYEFNEWGYRTKNIDDLDKDFALVFGCSYTEGIGLYQKDIWCEKLCKELDIDIFNLAKGGSSPCISYMNTTLYVKNLIRYKPKLVICQWPQAFRRTFSHLQEKSEKVIMADEYDLKMVGYNINTEASNMDMSWFKDRWLKEDGEMYKESFFNFYSTDILWKALDVPVYHWTWSGDFTNKYDKPFGFIEDDKIRVIKNKSNDKARDNGHDGKQIHSDVVDFLIDDIRKLL